jgi:hypothetical protein
VSGPDGLERRYQRLLAWYPADHRQAHGEEMLAVLLAATPPGRRRPSIADTLDLIKGGLQTRTRSGRSDGLDTGWGDTLAVASIAIPALLLIYFAMWLWVGPFQSASTFVVLLFTALPPVLALLRYRRTATLICLGPVLFLGFVAAQFMAHSTWISGQVAGLFLAFLVMALAIARSSGPARGLRVMNGWTWAAVCAIGLTVVIREATVGRLYVQPGVRPGPGWWIIPLGVAAAAAALALLRTLPAPVGKRLLFLLAIPAYPSLVSIVAGGYAATPLHRMIYLPTLAILGVAAVRASRPPRRSRS